MLISGKQQKMRTDLVTDIYCTCNKLLNTPSTHILHISFLLTKLTKFELEGGMTNLKKTLHTARYICRSFYTFTK